MNAYEKMFSLIEEMERILSVNGPKSLDNKAGGNLTLYSNLPSCSEPDWRNFRYFGYKPSRENVADGVTESLPYENKHLAQFWSVYGRKKGCEDLEVVCITDVATEKMAVRLCKLFVKKTYDILNTPAAGTHLNGYEEALGWLP